LRNETTQITDDVQALSHELHSSKLEYLGIDGAARIFCREFGERQKVMVDFQSEDVPADLPSNISISVFRVLQEALRNAIKHSGVNRFEVRLWGIPGEIHLTVGDRGKGLEMETAMRNGGLGLTSMQERLRFVGGQLSINSKLNSGTVVHARVPFHSALADHRDSGVLSSLTSDVSQE
jgi:signal transduction histidine kinase